MQESIPTRRSKTRMAGFELAPPVSFTPGERGIFHVGRDERRQPVALRFFDFALRSSFELGPPLSGDASTLTLSARRCADRLRESLACLHGPHRAGMPAAQLAASEYGARNGVICTAFASQR